MVGDAQEGFEPVGVEPQFFGKLSRRLAPVGRAEWSSSSRSIPRVAREAMVPRSDMLLNLATASARPPGEKHQLGIDELGCQQADF